MKCTIAPGTRNLLYLTQISLFVYDYIFELIIPLNMFTNKLKGEMGRGVRGRGEGRRQGGVRGGKSERRREGKGEGMEGGKKSILTLYLLT